MTSPERCWLCFHALDGTTVCPLCGAEARAAVEAPRPVAEAAPPSPAPALPPRLAGPAPDLSSFAPVDDLWEEDHVQATRRRNRMLAALGAGLLLLLVFAVIATRPGSSGSPSVRSSPRAGEPAVTGPASDVITTFGHGLRSRAAGLVATNCVESRLELRCTFRSGPVAASAVFRAIRNAEDGESLLEARLTGATAVSRVLRPDGEAATFRLALGGTDAEELPWVAWYSSAAALYAEVSTTDEDPANLRLFYSEQSS